MSSWCFLRNTNEFCCAFEVQYFGGHSWRFDRLLSLIICSYTLHILHPMWVLKVLILIWNICHCGLNYAKLLALIQLAECLHITNLTTGREIQFNCIISVSKLSQSIDGFQIILTIVFVGDEMRLVRSHAIQS